MASSVTVAQAPTAIRAEDEPRADPRQTAFRNIMRMRVRPGAPARRTTGNVNWSALLIAAACVPSCRPAPEATIDRYAEVFEARQSNALPTTEAHSAAFATAFAAVARAEALSHISACAVAAEDTIYLASRSDSSLLRWVAGERNISKLPVRNAVILRPSALTWDATSHQLLVLDAGQNKVLRVDDRGTVADQVPINGGQTGFALVALAGGEFLVGGERWTDTHHATLMARYDADGRVKGTFMTMDSAVVTGNLLVYEPVIVSSLVNRRILVVEPTSHRIHWFDDQGKELDVINDAPPEYVSPSPLSSELPPPDALWHWMTQWTPVVFVHAMPNRLFRVIKLTGSRELYQIDVRGASGRLLGAPLVAALRPLCASGARFVFVSPGGGTHSTVFAFDFVAQQ